MASTNAGQMVVEIPMEEGEPLGATPNEKLVITKVQPGTVADGKLKMGDQVLMLNNTKVEDKNHFFNLLRYAPPVAILHIIRDEKRAEELEAKVHIPADRAKLIQRRDGFEYLVSPKTLTCSSSVQLVKIEWKSGGPKLGLGIRHYQNRVLVSRCDPGTLAAVQLKVGDHIIDVDGKPVTDKDVAREMLLKSLQTQHFASMVIERPESMEAKHWTQTALAANPQQPPSVAMNSDVRDIAAKERAKLKAKPAAPKSILGRSSGQRKVQIVDKVGEHVIASDNEGKNLRAVRK
ncbi:hypothetical protein M3Y94_00961600 [Aphelenchoides besseyi]|nr:hypothetical protein M3Y94_00961600 [Aphelenchoides besseyi]